MNKPMIYGKIIEIKKKIDNYFQWLFSRNFILSSGDVFALQNDDVDKPS